MGVKVKESSLILIYESLTIGTLENLQSSAGVRVPDFSREYREHGMRKGSNFWLSVLSILSDISKIKPQKTREPLSAWQVFEYPVPTDFGTGCIENTDQRVI
jgi:hypothetical protein